MALCINNSGTYRNITTLCVNNSGTYRDIAVGCINDSGTYRLFTSSFKPPLGSCFGGGFVICRQESPNVRWVVSPYSAEVGRSWYDRNDANTTAQSVSGCTGWFVPTCAQLQNPGYCCRSFWGPSPCYSSTCYWSSSNINPNYAFNVDFSNGNVSCYPFGTKDRGGCVRAFRCVTY